MLAQAPDFVCSEGEGARRRLCGPETRHHPVEKLGEGRVVDYHLRQAAQKRRAVEALRGLNYTVFAAGDSYNDTNMLGAADAGILFRPPDNVIREFPQFPVTRTYEDLREAFIEGEKRCR